MTKLIKLTDNIIQVVPPDHDTITWLIAQLNGEEIRFAQVNHSLFVSTVDQHLLTRILNRR